MFDKQTQNEVKKSVREIWILIRRNIMRLGYTKVFIDEVTFNLNILTIYSEFSLA